MNKNQALNRYHRVRELRGLAPLSLWQEIFPTPVDLLKFWDETAKLSWPENYGQSPWDDAYTVAGALTDDRAGKPMSQSTVEHYLRYVDRCEHTAHRLRIMAAYGVLLPRELAEALAAEILLAC
jgi:hypothetical protein